LPGIPENNSGDYLGGALGNVIDRMLREMVVDFIDFHCLGSLRSAFNSADIGISFGITCFFGG
jgi:signal peptidase II